jgi:hypothetical protein
VYIYIYIHILLTGRLLLSGKRNTNVWEQRRPRAKKNLSSRCFGLAHHRFASPGLVTILILDLSLHSGAPSCSFLYFNTISDMLNILMECDLVLPYSYLTYFRQLFADLSTLVTRFHFRTRPYSFYGGQIGNGTCLSPSVLTPTVYIQISLTTNAQCSSGGHHVAV